MDKSVKMLLTVTNDTSSLKASMTTKETLRELRRAGKKIGIARLYELIEELNIQPVGARQRPQHYPEDTVERILNHFGLPDKRKETVS
jgi:hypothetical protein